MQPGRSRIVKVIEKHIARGVCESILKLTIPNESGGAEANPAARAFATSVKGSDLAESLIIFVQFRTEEGLAAPRHVCRPALSD